MPEPDPPKLTMPDFMIEETIEDITRAIFTSTEAEVVIADDPPDTLILEQLYDWIEDPKAITERETPREPGLHASSLHEVCGRREILIYLALMQDLGDLKVSNNPHTVGNYMTFDAGHMLHHLWQDKYFGPSQLLYGNWKCLGCLNVMEDRLMPKKCSSCGAERWRIKYEEMKVRVSLSAPVVGSTDGVIIEEAGNVLSKKRILELKSLSPSRFKLKKAPDPEHIVQVHVYMKGMGLDEAILVYIDRGKQCSWSVRNGEFKAGQPNVKTYVVKFDEKLWAEIEAMVEVYALAVANIALFEAKAEDLRVLHPKNYNRVCDTDTCPKARSCPVVDLCFSV